MHLYRVSETRGHKKPHRASTRFQFPCLSVPVTYLNPNPNTYPNPNPNPNPNPYPNPHPHPTVVGQLICIF